MITHLNKLKIIFEAEDAIGSKFSPVEVKQGNMSLEFREVFKWVMSPINSKKLDSRVNLDSKFFINCTFAEKKDEKS